MPDGTNSNLAVELELLKETAANPKRLNYGANPLTGDKELVRLFTSTRDEVTSKILTALNSRSCASGKPGQQYVDDPVADGVVYPGRWRVVSNAAQRKQTAPELQGVAQTLRFGYLEKLDPASSAILFNEARLAPSNTVDDSDDLLAVQWTNISPRKVHEIAGTLTSANYTDPIIDGETYSGDWKRVRVESSLAEDGSGIVTLYLTLAPYSQTFYQAVGTLKPETVVRHFNVPKAYVASVIAGYNTAGSRQVKNVTVEYGVGGGIATVTASTVTIESISDTITLTTNWDTKETQSLYLNLTLAETQNLANALDVLSNTVIGKDISYRRKNNGDKTYDVDVIVRSKLQDDGAYDNEQTYTLASSFDSDEEVIKQWNLTEDEVQTFIEANELDTREAGISKRFDESRDSVTGLFNVTASITRVDLTTLAIVTSLEAIDGELTAISSPQREAEVRSYTWFNVADANADSIINTLAAASITQWVVVEVVNRFNKTAGVHDITFTIAKVGLAEHQTSIRNVAAEVEEITVTLLNRDQVPATTPVISGYTIVATDVQEKGTGITTYVYVFSKDGLTDFTIKFEAVNADLERREITLLNRPIAPSDPTLSGYTLVEKRVLRAGSTQSDYVYVFFRNGTATFEERTLYPSAEAEEITRVLFRRTADPGALAVAGYVLLERLQNNVGQPQVDYVYRYVKAGTVENQTRINEYDAEGEEVEITLLNRASEPGDPGLSGYAIVAKLVNRAGTSAPDYIYQFRKIGVTEITVGTRFPGFTGEQVVLSLFNRDAKPATPTQAGYTLIEEQTVNAEGKLPTYIYTFVKNGDGVTPQTIAYLTPGFFERRIELYPNVPDTSLATVLSNLRTIANSDEVVEEVRSDYNGRGVANVSRTVILLPDDHTESETAFETRDAALTPSTFSVISAYASYTSDANGTTSYTPTVIKVPTTFYSGHQVRRITVTREIAYHKTMPSSPVSSGTYASQTSYKKSLLLNGIWVLETITTARTVWGTTA